MVWKMEGLTPPDVRPMMRAADPVASPMVPTVTPRAWVAAPPMRPWMTFPSPRLMLGDTVTSALNWRVDVRANETRLVTDESVVASTSVAEKLPTEIEEILAVEIEALFVNRDPVRTLTELTSNVFTICVLI